MNKPLPRCLSVIINDRCPLHCRHCSVGYTEGYNGTNVKPTEKELRSVIRAVNNEIYDIVGFIGGEPSLVPNLLATGINECHSCKILSSITTAPIWARTLDGARRFLAKLPDFDFLVLSYDRYHLEFLNVNHYENALNAALERGIKVVINLCYSLPEERTELLNGIWHWLDRLYDVHLQSIIPIGNAAIDKNIPFTGVWIENAVDVDRLQRSCTIGSVVVGVGNEVHACCWASAINGSPFRYGVGRTEAVEAALENMEADQTFRKFINTGLIGNLTKEGAEAIVETVKGMCFVNECHLCMYLMTEPNRRIWNAHIRHQH